MKRCIYIGLMVWASACWAQPHWNGPTSKKGACITTKKGNKEKWPQKVASLNVSWHYSWGARLYQPELRGVEFVPMMYGFYGIRDDFKETITGLRGARFRRTRRHLLGFNEPDKKNQANLSVEKALEVWPYLQHTGLRLGSPATVHADQEWMQRFMKGVKERKLRVDFVTVHWYGAPNADQLVRHLTKVHEMYGKPIWLTEFAVADWSAKDVSANRHSTHSVHRFMSEVLPRLDKLDFVERYAWFNAGPNHPALGPSALFKQDGSLTWLGKLYAGHGKTN